MALLLFLPPEEKSGVTTRAEAIQILTAHDAALDEVIAALPQAVRHHVAAPGDERWSAADAIGHIAFWTELALEAIERWRTDDPPRVVAIFRDRTIDRANLEDVIAHRNDGLSAAQQRLDRARRALIARIDALTDDDWRHVPSFALPRRRPLGEFIAGVLGAPDRPFGHVSAHLDDLRATAG